MRHLYALTTALLGFALAEVDQLPLQTTLDNAFGNYQGDQVWRLDWAHLDSTVKEEITQAIEVRLEAV